MMCVAAHTTLLVYHVGAVTVVIDAEACACDRELGGSVWLVC